MAIGKMGPRDDDEDHEAGGEMRLSAGSARNYTTAKDAAREVGRVIETMDHLRSEVVSLYFFAAGGTVVEHELGEALQAIRKSLVRLRKARDEMSGFDQPPLPLE